MFASRCHHGLSKCFTTLAAVAIGFTTDAVADQTNRVSAALPGYEFRAEHDPSGIGKFYLGREIAQVMGHEGADWLERSTRPQEEGSDLLVPLLKLKLGHAVADIGCGTGYYTRRLAKAVGTNGVVYAEDIQPEMLTLLTNKLRAEGIHNVRPVLGTITDPKLPRAAIDLILMVDVYHEFDHPHEMISTMIPALKPGGRIAFVEFRGEDEQLAIKRLHKMTEAQVKKEMTLHPLTWSETITNLPQQHLIIFRRQ